MGPPDAEGIQFHFEAGVVMKDALQIQDELNLDEVLTSAVVDLRSRWDAGVVWANRRHYYQGAPPAASVLEGAAYQKDYSRAAVLEGAGSMMHWVKIVELASVPTALESPGASASLLPYVPVGRSSVPTTQERSQREFQLQLPG
jgi:hypothetical protein